MKRYLLFCYDQYYPCGGMKDFKGDFDTLEDALEKAAMRHYDNYHIYDIVLWQIVKENYVLKNI